MLITETKLLEFYMKPLNILYTFVLLCICSVHCDSELF